MSDIIYTFKNNAYFNFSFLPAAVADGTDKNARTQMAMAAYEAGISFCNSSVTVVHGMSRPIGAIFHVPHGISNAMLLDECMKYVVSGAYDKIGRASCRERV